MVQTLIGHAHYQEDIKKSRFLALAAPVRSVEEAVQFITAQHQAQATHNCWAWRIGQAYRFHDDGEPGGTAGRPILQAIESQDCDQVAVAVVRWFGGIKLGTGGLARAYGGTAAQCLRLADKVAIVEERKVHCQCAFADLARVQARLTEAGVRIETETYTADGVAWCLAIESGRVAAVAALFADLTRGQGGWIVQDHDQAQAR
ncbi:IMPACT family protein [Alcaligenaceae bacterium CGII-47]|nr:IMPACT family protein [Alcaligenaceae bacterium CGII-47]